MVNSHQLSVPDSEIFKVLSIDKGGIKGLYSARVLEHFEDRFNCHISDYFDMICGTSTGGLLALALSLNIPASLMSNLYYRRGKQIFPQQNTFLSSLKQLFLRSKYDNRELKRVLQEIFGERTISDSRCLLCIPAFSLTDGRPFIFKYDHAEGNLCRDGKTRYVDIALATSAAPAYLPIVTIDSYDDKQFIDGGIYANNPTLVGVVEALRYFVGTGKRFQKLMVMSISSLDANPGRRFLAKHNRSVIDWNKDLISTFFEGQAYLTNYFVDTLANHCDSPFDYVRIPGTSLAPVQAQIINMDNTSNEALQLMSQKEKEQALFWGRKPEVAQFFYLANCTLSSNYMANCDKLFRIFNTVIALDSTRKGQLRTSRNAVRERIRTYFREKQNGLFPKFHGQGSLMMNTIIRPLDGEFDVDDGIYFLVDKQPTYSVNTFHDWIYKAVDGYTKQPSIDKQTCVSVVYAGDYHLDLPIYYVIQGQTPYLAHKGKGWIESDPREFIQWFNNKADKDGQLKRIVRYLKAWSDYRCGQLPSGLIFSILAANNISYHDRDDMAFYQTLLSIKNSLDTSFVCYRPTTPAFENLLADYSKTNEDYFLKQLDSFIQSAEKALHEKTSQLDACKAWQRQFGAKRFPCNLSSAGTITRFPDVLGELY